MDEVCAILNGLISIKNIIFTVFIFRTDANYSGPDLDDVRESVRHGVHKVAGRLSSMATDMMSSLQDKYGG